MVEKKSQFFKLNYLEFSLRDNENGFDLVCGIADSKSGVEFRKFFFKMANPNWRLWKEILYLRVSKHAGFESGLRFSEFENFWKCTIAVRKPKLFQM